MKVLYRYRVRMMALFGMLLLIAGRAPAGVVTHRPVIRIDRPEEGGAVLLFDLSVLPKGTKIYRARLVCEAGAADLDATKPPAPIEIYPLESPHRDGQPLKVGAEPLAPAGPWYDAFEMTELANQWLSGIRANHGLLVKHFTGWREDKTHLDLMFEGEIGEAPPQVSDVNVVHRAGQTFIVFREIDDRSSDPSPSWTDLKTRLETMDRERTVRYLVFRHDRPIDTSTLAEAELLAEVEPMSGYNVRGRSVDQLIKLHRQRAVDDLDFAKRLAKGDYFQAYHPDMPEMGEVAIGRLAVEHGRPLPPGTGLYVHHPGKPGRVYYAVLTSVDGVANTKDLSGGNSLREPVSETVGAGVPVYQGTPDVTVFFDYPGERRHYVQWTAPPLSNLPDQYYNWGVFVPRDYNDAPVKRLSVFFHDHKQRYLKPPWPHRQDTVLLSPHDAPFRSFGYGYHEALGTLRSFRQGRVRPFFARRVDAMIDWAIEEFSPDPGRISCGGHGPWGGTAALQYALHRPGRIAYVMADGSPDPDPQQTPREYKHYGRENEQPRWTHLAAMEAVWGRVEWAIEAESGRSIWEELNLPALVRSDPDRTRPYVSLGAGGMHVTWKQETDLMKAYLETGNAFMSRFYWGGRDFLPLPTRPEQGEYPFEPRADRPILACRPLTNHPNPKFFEPGGQFDAGRRGYSSGGRLGNRPRWDPEDMVDTPDRLEMTIYSARRVSYAGKVDCDVTVRNTRRFRPGVGETVAWRVVSVEGKQTLQEGKVLVGESGRFVLPGVTFDKPARLILECIRIKEKEG